MSDQTGRPAAVAEPAAAAAAAAAGVVVTVAAVTRKEALRCGARPPRPPVGATESVLERQAIFTCGPVGTSHVRLLGHSAASRTLRMIIVFVPHPHDFKPLRIPSSRRRETNSSTSNVSDTKGVPRSVNINTAIEQCNYRAESSLRVCFFRDIGCSETGDDSWIGTGNLRRDSSSRACRKPTVYLASIILMARSE